VYSTEHPRRRKLRNQTLVKSTQNDINHTKPEYATDNVQLSEDFTASLYPKQAILLFSVNTCLISASITSQLYWSQHSGVAKLN